MNSIFSAQKLVCHVVLPINFDRFTVWLESNNRCLQDIWTRHRVFATGSTFDRGVLYLSRTSWRTFAIPYRSAYIFPSSDLTSLIDLKSKMSHLPPPSIRNVISVPTQDRIDFRAACFCHKNVVDVGFVCSVCLSSALSNPACISIIIILLICIKYSASQCLYALHVGQFS